MGQPSNASRSGLHCWFVCTGEPVSLWKLQYFLHPSTVRIGTWWGFYLVLGANRRDMAMHGEYPPVHNTPSVHDTQHSRRVFSQSLKLKLTSAPTLSRKSTLSSNRSKLEHLMVGNHLPLDNSIREKLIDELEVIRLESELAMLDRV